MPIKARYTILGRYLRHSSAFIFKLDKFQTMQVPWDWFEVGKHQHITLSDGVSPFGKTLPHLMKTYGWATCSHGVEFLLCDKNGKVGQKRLILLGLLYLGNFPQLADGFTKHMHSRHGRCMFLIMKRQAACSSVVSNNGFPSLGPLPSRPVVNYSAKRI